jgi:hypothetical protein
MIITRFVELLAAPFTVRAGRSRTRRSVISRSSGKTKDRARRPVYDRLQEKPGNAKAGVKTK